jgi:large subunit ribosomal protein L21
MTTNLKTTPTGQTFAVIQTGGKQYKVAVGDILKVEKLADAKAGDKITFDKVMLVDDGSTTKVGTPYVEGKKVEASVVSEGRHAKLLVVKYLAKSRYFKKNGHRQPFTEVKIEAIA